MMKRVVSVLIVILLTISAMTACTAPSSPAASTPAEQPGESEAPAAEAPAEKSYKFGLMLYSSVDEATITIMNGVKKVAEENGIELVIGENGGDATKTAALLQNMFTQEVDAIIDATWDGNVGLTTSAQCKERGIPLVTCDVAYDDYAHLVGANNYGSGQVNGAFVTDWVKENWGGEIEYILCMYPYFAGEGVKARLDGCLDYLKEQGLLPEEANIIWQDNSGQTDDTKPIVTDFLTAHPDAHKIFILPNNDAGALGAYNAALTMDREADCVIVSYNADSFALDHLATVADSCWKGTVNFNLAGYGALAIPALVEILETGTDNIPHELNTQTFVIDHFNVKDYIG